MSASYGQTMASLSNLFQSGFAKSLGQSSGMGGGIGGANTVMNLMKTSLTPGGTNAGFMTNPANPLQGVSALSGIGNFASNIQAIGAARKMGLLPSTQQGGGGTNPLGMMGALGGLGQMGGMMPATNDPMQQLMAMLMSMIGMMSGGGGQQATGLGGGLGQPTGLGGGLGQPAGLGGGLGQPAGLGGGGVFGGINNFAGIDAGINYGLSGVANTLSLIGLSV